MKTQVKSKAFDAESIKADFPILDQKIHGQPLVYLDNAATTQKPVQVIDSISNFYRSYNSNIHRGVHYLSNKATDAYENARKRAASFINARHEKEINFVRGTTEGINLVANSWGRKFLSKGDEILISAMEHHSNIVPWQMICDEKGAKLRIIPINANGEIQMNKFTAMLNAKVKLVSVVHVSNSLGTINPVAEIIIEAHKNDILVMVDGAQAVQHIKVDVQSLNADFYVFSGHKMYGPTGIGVLYGKEQLLESMNPYMGGGEMIREVKFEKTTFNKLPYKFEAGTPNIAGAIGLAAAIDYLNDLELDSIANWESDLLNYATNRLNEISGLRLIGRAEKKASVISFLLGHHHPYDVGVLLDQQGIAIRTGHHCTEPLMDYLGIPGTCRASIGLYNTKDDIDRLIDGIKKASEMLG